VAVLPSELKVTEPGIEQPNSQVDCCRVNVLVLTVEGFNATLNVAVMDGEVVETPVAPSSGVVLVTEGGGFCIVIIRGVLAFLTLLLLSSIVATIEFVPTEEEL
jgi:hypothetical protein